MIKIIFTFLSLATLLISSNDIKTPKLEIIAQWDFLKYDIKDEKIRNRWEQSKIYNQALIQGIKLDANENIYATTARWKGKDIPATLSKIKNVNDEKILVPYPSEAFNDISNPKGIKSVLGFEIDENNVMWILDQGHIAGQPTKFGDEKLVLWDIDKNKELQRYNFSDKETNRECSFLNDIVVDNNSGFAYITDSGVFCKPLEGGLLVYDKKNNKSRRVLSGTKFTNNEKDFFFNVNSKPASMITGADGIALTGDRKTLYWTNLTGNILYSIPTIILRDFSVSEAEIQASVEIVNILPSNTDGMTSDSENNLYMTGLSINGVMYRDAKTHKVSRLLYNPEMIWPDTFSWGQNGDLYMISNNINSYLDGTMDFKNPNKSNFIIWRFRVNKKSYLHQK
ncbi:MAG: sugar lactone lactonase YvrE [Sulfurimonas sp.]|jgi:sugar lactone lactonase YvrE|uniref:L-dopachrome tautomerase-related protein n=1 Tax=Sulfurimonas sp. TaxID=2022749 RepID=UPI0039E675F6